MKKSSKYEWLLHHTELTTKRSILFRLFEIKRVFVYNSTLFKLTDFLFYAFLFKMHMPTKHYLRKKAVKLCIRGQIVIT